MYTLFLSSVLTLFVFACSANRADPTDATPPADLSRGSAIEESVKDKVFDIKNASQYFDLIVTVATCDDIKCTGKAKFEFIKKGETAPYQTIDHEDTYFDLFADGKPYVNGTPASDKYSAVYIDDFNFDGMDDVSICDGLGGSYSMPSYRLYLSSRPEKKFVLSEGFTELGRRLGMFEVDKRSKRIRVFDKSGCCIHITEEYTVSGNQPVKVLTVEEDATDSEKKKVKFTTKKLVNGRWQATVGYMDWPNPDLSLLKDAYLTMPAKYLRFDQCNPNSNVDKECIKYRAEYLNMYVTIDERNYFNTGGESFNPTITLALFRRTNGSFVVGVSSETTVGWTIGFLEKKGGKWVDVSRSVIPDFDQKNYYQLQRYDKSIEVRRIDPNDDAGGDYGPRIYDLVWKNDKFTISK